MNENIDAYVSTPDVGVNKDLTGFFIQFEETSRAGLPMGKTHTIAMKMETAMQLLSMLEQVQERFSLHKPTNRAVVTEISSQKKN
jgi:hypothetical protein